jgi:hypothetical protein
MTCLILQILEKTIIRVEDLTRSGGAEKCFNVVSDDDESTETSRADGKSSHIVARAAYKPVSVL